MTTAAPAGPLALSLEDLPGPAFVLDGPDGRVREHNTAFAVWAGRPDVEGLAISEILPDDPGALRLWHEARDAGAAEHHVARRGARGERSTFILHARRTPLGVLVCATDLTATEGAAHAAFSSAQDYVAVSAHELRAPLSAIKAWASALRAQSSEPAAVEGLGAIARQVDRMNDLLTDLFDAARAGSGAIRADRAPVAVDALVRGLPASSRIALHGALPGRVFVDGAQIAALLLRLAGWIAARQPEGPIAVGSVVLGSEVHLTVADGGPALPPRAEAEVFGHGPRAVRGLGLYLCQHLAAVNGARVWREPDLEASGDGAAVSRFCLSLPTSAPAKAPGPVRALVADDDVARRARTVAALRLEGHEVSGVADTAAILRELGAPGAWDVVIAESTILGAPASAAIREVRASAGPPAIVVIAPSTERPEALDGAERAGASAVLGRPVDWVHLLSLVACLGARR